MNIQIMVDGGLSYEMLNVSVIPNIGDQIDILDTANDIRSIYVKERMFFFNLDNTGFEPVVRLCCSTSKS